MPKHAGTKMNSYTVNNVVIFPRVIFLLKRALLISFYTYI